MVEEYTEYQAYQNPVTHEVRGGAGGRGHVRTQNPGGHDTR